MKVSALNLSPLCLILLLCSSLHLINANDCVPMAPANYKPPSDFYRMTNATFIDIPRKVPATTLAWEVNPVIGLDRVRLHISLIVDHQDEKMYHLDPITTNRNLANTKDIFIYIRLSYLPISNKDSKIKNSNKMVKRSYKYYVLDNLVGCNADLVIDDQVDYDSIEWSYAVLNF